MPKINKVGKLKIGDHFWDEGVKFEVTSFPTRTSVCGENENPTEGEPSSCKLSVSKIKTAPPLSKKERVSFIEFADAMLDDPYLSVDDVKKEMKRWWNFVRLDPVEIVKAMGRVTGFTYHQMMNSSEHIVAEARFCCCYYIWKKGGTQDDMARFFGKKNHSAITHGIRLFTEKIGIKDPRITRMYNAFIEELGKNS